MTRCLLLLILTLPLWPCECTPMGPACETFHGAKAVFLGTVLDYHYEEETYLVRVDEAFKGILPGESKVVIDPSIHTSCVARHTPGKQYLFITAGALGTLVRGRRAFVTGLCSPTKEASEAAEDLAWLRSPAKPPAFVSGLVLQRPSFVPRLPGPPVVAGAQLTLANEDHEFRTTADTDGAYRFDAVPPGDYTLTAIRPPWTDARPQNVSVVANGCANRYPVLLSRGVISGRVIHADGRPAEGISVYAVFFRKDGKLMDFPTILTNTGHRGLFRMTEVPAGDLVIRVHPKNGRRLRLEPNGVLTGVTLTLPEPQR